MFKFDTNKGGAFLERNKDYYNRLAQGDWYLVKDSRYPVNEEEADDAWRRAEERIGETEYSLLFNNCEHFVTECLTGQGSSEQVEALLESSGASSRVADGSSAALSTGSSGGSFSYQDVKTLVYGTLQHLINGEFQDMKSTYLSLTKRRKQIGF